MKRKKSLFLVTVLVISLALPLVACSNSPKKNTETRASSIFQRSEVENCKITADTAQVKSGAGNNFNTIGTLNKNKVVDVIGEIGDWYVVRLDNNRIGAVDSSQAKPVVKEDKPQERKQPEEVPQKEPPPQPSNEPQSQQPKRSNQEDSINPADETTAKEKQMIDLINKERSKNDVPPLKADLKVTSVARKKAADMVENNYFSHHSPTYGSPFDMLDRFGIEYLQAGENIAGNSSVKRAHDSLMNSRGHRRNILNPNYTHVGIGIKSSDKYGFVFTQMFISKPK